MAGKHSLEPHIECSCGCEVPSRWAVEGKIGLRNVVKDGSPKLEKYCVNCASDAEYELLIKRFSAYIKK